MQARPLIVLAATLLLASAAAAPSLAQSQIDGSAPPASEAARAAPVGAPPQAGAVAVPGISANRDATRALSLDPDTAKRAWSLIGRSSDGGEVRLEPGEGVIRALEGEQRGAVEPEGGGGTAAAFVEDEESRAIVGADNRVRVSNTRAYPFSAVGYLQMQNAAGEHGFCTAALIGPRIAVTAAHCLYNHAVEGGWLDNFAFWPGLNGENDNPFGGHDYKTVYVFDAFVTDYDGSYDSVWYYDIGLIEFAEPIGDNLTGWLGTMGAGDDNDFEGNLVGYQNDKEAFTQWRSVCSVPAEDIGALAFLHQCDVAASGSSGAPIYVLNRQNGNRHVVGLHIGPEGSGNWALRLHQPIFEWVSALYNK